MVKFSTLLRVTLIVQLLLFTTHFTAAAKQPRYAAYLFAYFEGTGPVELQEHLRFAISEDGTTWQALNGNRPVVLSDSVCLTLGLRDPHLLRAEDGRTFLLVATDMKATRDGWTTNPGIVLMRSRDLIHWEHHTVQLDRLWPERFGDVRYTWAPQTIYDPEARRYMIYFTIIFKDEAAHADTHNMTTYYAYANDAFSGLATEPQVLFAPRCGCIDNDIVRTADGTWHMFYKGHIDDADGREIQNGIMHTTSACLLGPWPEATDFVDAYAKTNTSVEGSGVYPLLDGSGWILQYDLFGAGRFEFQRADPLLRTFEPHAQRYDKNFHPRHGYVIPITRREARRLRKAFP